MEQNPRQIETAAALLAALLLTGRRQSAKFAGLYRGRMRPPLEASEIVEPMETTNLERMRRQYLRTRLLEINSRRVGYKLLFRAIHEELARGAAVETAVERAQKRTGFLLGGQGHAYRVSNVALLPSGKVEVSFSGGEAHEVLPPSAA